MHPALLNGHVRCTLIESFSGEVSEVRPGFKKEFDKGLLEAKKFIDDQGWDISISIIQGSLILRQMMAHDKCQFNTCWIAIEDVPQPINIECIGDYNGMIVPKDATKGCGFVPAV